MRSHGVAWGCSRLQMCPPPPNNVAGGYIRCKERAKRPSFHDRTISDNYFIIRSEWRCVVRIRRKRQCDGIADLYTICLYRSICLEVSQLGTPGRPVSHDDLVDRLTGGQAITIARYGTSCPPFVTYHQY